MLANRQIVNRMSEIFNSHESEPTARIDAAKALSFEYGMEQAFLAIIELHLISTSRLKHLEAVEE
ncbi:hypothetical protein O4H53_23675 [Sulfitobacter sp. G21635-S1]|nr:hypothetical protein [Sulfitobacter sp. G21635-S1]